MKQRLLVNAEPFGFGPSAAVADVFPSLRQRFSHLAYVGKGHSLDLQRGLPYDEIHDMTGVPPEEEAQAFTDVASSYDALFTAVDFRAAEWATTCGLPVIFYDMLTYYWPDHNLPDVLRRVHRYVAQDFLGVRERLAARPDVFPRAVVVSPLVTPKARSGGEHVLVNLGGLQNPLWSTDDAASYARLCVNAVRAALAPGERALFATSRAVCQLLADPDVNTHPYEEMKRLLERATCACMVPGLANIYEAGAYNLPTVWLPPASDSHGQQLALLQRHGLADGSVDWRDLEPEDAVDYFGWQDAALEGITAFVRRAREHEGLQQRFRTAVAEQLGRVRNLSSGRARALLERFGSGGAAQVAEQVRHAVDGLN